MKKTLALILFLVLIGLTACGGGLEIKPDKFADQAVKRDGYGIIIGSYYYVSTTPSGAWRMGFDIIPITGKNHPGLKFYKVKPQPNVKEYFMYFLPADHYQIQSAYFGNQDFSKTLGEISLSEPFEVLSNTITYVGSVMYYYDENTVNENMTVYPELNIFDIAITATQTIHWFARVLNDQTSDMDTAYSILPALMDYPQNEHLKLPAEIESE